MLSNERAIDIKEVRSEIFEHSSHLPHVEETDCYLEVVARFLDACNKTR